MNKLTMDDLRGDVEGIISASDFIEKTAARSCSSSDKNDRDTHSGWKPFETVEP